MLCCYIIILISCLSRSGVSVCVSAGEPPACCRLWMDQVGMGNAVQERKGALTQGEVLPRPASSQSEVRKLASEPAHSWEHPVRLHYLVPTDLNFKFEETFTRPHVILKPCDFICEHSDEHLLCSMKKHKSCWFGATGGPVNDDRAVEIIAP